MDKYFMVRVKRSNGTIEKGVEVKENLDDARQSYHAYLGAYAYGHDANTDYVLVQILNAYGLSMGSDFWEKEQETVNE